MASTYCNLGMVADEQTDYDSSLAYFVMALEIFDEYNEENNLGIVRRNLSLLLAIEQWNATKAIDALAVGEETKKVLRTLLKNIQKAPADD